jgi:hypothetical protein
MIPKFFLQPYPFEGQLKKHFIHNFVIGCFIAFFLIVFQPFDTNLWQTEHKTLKLMGFGFISFLMPFLMVVVQSLFQKLEIWEEKWTVGREIISLIITLTSISFGNMLFSNFLGVTHFSLGNFLGFFTTVITLGLFPIAAGILLRYNHYKNLNQKEANVLSQNIQDFQKTSIEEQENKIIKNEKINLLAENEKDTISLNINDLLYIESADNYANIVFFKDKKIQKELLRGALKRFENQLENLPFIQRCHRSFIVNLQHVEDINGNAQGYRIALKNCDAIVPVARNYGSMILGKIKQAH